MENKEYIQLRKSQPSPLKKLEFFLQENTDTIATVGGVIIQNPTDPMAYAITCYHCIAPKFNCLTYTVKAEHDHLQECNDKTPFFRILDNLRVQIEGNCYGIGESDNILFHYDNEIDIALVPVLNMKIERTSIKEIPIHHDSIDRLDFDLDEFPIIVSKWGAKTNSTTGSHQKIR